MPGEASGKGKGCAAVTGTGQILSDDDSICMMSPETDLGILELLNAWRQEADRWRRRHASICAFSVVQAVVIAALLAILVGTHVWQ